MNQWPHILDLWQWVCGMPTRLQATCRFGGHHNIEVEDEVHVFAEYENGATVFLTGSTGEAPGSERIEIVGSQGRIIADGDQLQLLRLKVPAPDFIATAQPGFPSPSSTVETETLDPNGDYAAGITRDFVAAIQNGTGGPLIAPGTEGAAGAMLANAILLSAWSDRAWIPLPLDLLSEERFEHLLAGRIRTSVQSAATSSAVFTLEDSFRRPG
ncbi:MAG: hypothetical protein H7Z41_04055 [Cytophagales bacterium]|nr:hypothetical protein [Armatimonadota bacterium]